MVENKRSNKSLEVTLLADARSAPQLQRWMIYKNIRGSAAERIYGDRIIQGDEE